MDYVGNFKDWIVKNKVIDYLESIHGDKVPVWQPDRWKGNAILDDIRERVRPGYSKLYPGEFQPMHVDPHLTELTNFKRFTMFLQDWEPGHIFTYDDKIITNYKAGDMYEWNDPMTLHGPVNIGYNTRYTLQITQHD